MHYLHLLINNKIIIYCMIKKIHTINIEYKSAKGI